MVEVAAAAGETVAESETSRVLVVASLEAVGFVSVVAVRGVGFSLTDAVAPVVTTTPALLLVM